MDIDDRYNPQMENDIDREVEDILMYDPGYNKLYMKVRLSNGKIKKRLVKVFSSSGVGTKIRNAESGFSYKDLVGSKNEDKYFKVSFSVGRLTSKNNSHTLFYNSPEEYMKHMNMTLDDKIINDWREKQTIQQRK